MNQTRLLLSVTHPKDLCNQKKFLHGIEIIQVTNALYWLIIRFELKKKKKNLPETGVGQISWNRLQAYL